MVALTEYRDQIRENVLVKQYYCDVDTAHLISYDEELASRLNSEPADIIPLVSQKITYDGVGTHCCVVRGCVTTMYTKDCLSVAKGHHPP